MGDFRRVVGEDDGDQGLGNEDGERGGDEGNGGNGEGDINEEEGDGDKEEEGHSAHRQRVDMTHLAAVTEAKEEGEALA